MKELKSVTENARKVHGLWIGEVINNTDPKNRNRIQVDIKGITNEVDDKSNYPWAEQGGTISCGSKSTNGISVSPSVGELVYIEFLNGSPSHPIYTAMVRGGSDNSEYFDGSNYVIHLPSGDVVKIGTGEILLISGGSIVTVKDGNIKLDNGDSIVNMNGGDVSISCSNFNVNSSTFTHNGTNVGDTHIHSEPGSIAWQDSSETVTDAPE